MSALNCKPGDLAVIVIPLLTNRNLGKLVLVLGPSTADPGDGEWLVRSLSGPIHRLWGDTVEAPMHDYRLRPIRDPGDGARDETLLWKPVPRTVTPTPCSHKKRERV